MCKKVGTHMRTCIFSGPALGGRGLHPYFQNPNAGPVFFQEVRSKWNKNCSPMIQKFNNYFTPLLIILSRDDNSDTHLPKYTC